MTTTKSKRRVRFSVAQSNQHIEWADYVAALKAADEMAFETFWSFDHLMPIGGDSDGSCHECYTTLAAHAALTKRIRIGALVTGAAYRNPALQIKMATQIDVISNGRLDFGIGAGWAEREYRAFNIPFHSPKERIGTLRETLVLAKRLWSGDPTKKVTYEGKYVQAHDLFLNPQPVQKPRPPILIGGGGRRVLQLAGQAADIVGINPSMRPGRPAGRALLDLTGERVAAKVAIAREAARAAGRDPDALRYQTSVLALTVTDAPRHGSWVSSLAADVRDPAVLASSPAVLRGSVADCVDTLLRRREELGLDYFHFGGDPLAAAPIVARLAGT